MTLDSYFGFLQRGFDAIFVLVHLVDVYPPVLQRWSQTTHWLSLPDKLQLANSNYINVKSYVNGSKPFSRHSHFSRTFKTKKCINLPSVMYYTSEVFLTETCQCFSYHLKQMCSTNVLHALVSGLLEHVCLTIRILTLLSALTVTFSWGRTLSTSRFHSATSVLDSKISSGFEEPLASWRRKKKVCVCSNFNTWTLIVTPDVKGDAPWVWM